MVKNIPTIERSTKIRFGKHANDNQAENTIVINASDAPIAASTPGSVYMTPLRVAELAGANFFAYHAQTAELVDSGVATDLLGGITLQNATTVGNTTANVVEFNHPTTAFVTSSNVGIANTLPTHALSVADKVFIKGAVGDNDDLRIVGNTKTNRLSTAGDAVVIDKDNTNKIQVSGIIHTGDIQATSHVAIANTNPQNLFTLGADGQTVMNVPTQSAYALETTGNINAQYYHGDGGLLSNLNLQIVTDKASITTNTLDLTHPTTSLKAYSNIVVDNYIFGNISGSNLITASNITSVNTSASTGLYGHVLGSNTISATNITATDISATDIQSTDIATNDLIATTGIYGEIKGSNVVSANRVSTLSMYGDILGSNVVEANKVSAGAGLYGEIKGSNAISASTITASSISGDGSSVTDIGTGNITTGVLDVARGGTGIGDTYTTGDIPYASAHNTISTLGVSSATAGQFLRLNPTKTAPIWSDVPLTLDEVLESQTGVSNVSNAVMTLNKASGVALEVTDAQVALNGTGTVLDASSGTISAQTFQGSFNGNGSNISYLDLGSGKGHTGIVPMARGGTGTGGLTNKSIPYVNASGVLEESKIEYDESNEITSISSNVVISGNLTIQGNVTSQHSNDHYITDKIFAVAHGNTIDAKDMGQHMTRPTANVFAGFLGQTIGKEYTIAYTTSKSESDTVTPTMSTSDGYITANVWGNVLSGNVTTTGKVTAGTAIEIASGGTGRNSFAENDLLLGPASGTALNKLAAYVPTAGSTVPANMSANSSGGNTASSSDSSANAYKAFDGSDSTNYVSPGAPSTYSYSIPYGYTGSNSLGGVNGEWVKIQLSSAITPTSVFLKARPDNSSPDWAVRPNSWRILGSNDDTSWTQLHSSSTLVDDTNGTTESFTNTTAYSYLAIVVTHINNPGSNDARWTLSRLSFTQPGSVSEKFLKSSATGISWDDTISGDGLGLTALNASNISTGTLTTARGGTGVTTGITVLNPLNLSSQVTMQKGGTGQTYLAENDLLLGPASGDVLSKLSAYTGPTSITAPPSGMSSTTQTIGGIQYTSSASSTYSGTATYNAFDHNNSTIWRSANNPGESYASMDGYYGGSSTTGSYSGAWIQLYRATAFAPTSIQIIPSQTTSIPAPNVWKVFGSTNGSSWTEIHSSSTAVAWNSGNGHTATISGSAAYNYLRLAVQQSTMAMSMGTIAVSEIRFSAQGTGPTEKFLKSSAAGVSWDEVSSTLQAITDGGATTTHTVAFNNTTTGLTSAGDIDIAATKKIDYAGDVLLKSSAGAVASFKVDNAIKLDPAYAAPSNNVLSFNTTTGEIYDSGGQGGSTLDNIHEYNANVSIGPSVAAANLTINTYESNVLTVSGNVAADNITIGALHVAASPFNLDDVASGTAGANVTSNVIQFTATGNAFVTTNNIKIGKDVHAGGNVYSQNLQLTNTQITSSFTTGSGTLTIDAQNKSYGTAPLTSIDADVAILDISNLPSGGQVVVPLLATGADRKVLKTITTGIDFIAFTSDVSIDQNGHALLTVSKIGASGAEKIYMNAISFTAA